MIDIALCALLCCLTALLTLGLTIAAYWLMRPGLAQDAAEVNNRPGGD